MTPGELLDALEERGIRLYVEAGLLRYRAPRGTFDGELRETARALRQELLADWMCPVCEEIHRVFYGFPGDQKCGRCVRGVKS